jgi:transposase
MLDGWAEPVAAVVARFTAADAAVEATVIHQCLVREYGFTGSYQAVRRYLKRTQPVAPVQAVRCVETPPGVQAQHDWGEVAVVINGIAHTAYTLLGTLSHSRATAAWVGPTMRQLAWQAGHLALFMRYGGVPRWIRIDNLKTAVATGAGPTAVLTPAFTTFARVCGFTVDPCRVRTPSDKGKIERQVRALRSSYADCFVRPWPSWEALQAALDQRSLELHALWRCPSTRTSVADALRAEQALLQPVPVMSEPFDLVVARRVARDCLVSAEGRRYSVPFAYVGREVEVRGTARHIVVVADGAVIARHPRHSASRLVRDATHYEGESTATVRAPAPLGRRAQQQLAVVPHATRLPAPEAITRPLSAYLALVGDAS